jgi:pyruvate-formate lyase-activating enzyme
MQGIFQAISDLEHAGVLITHEQETYDAVYDWFRINLKKPDSFTRSSKPHAKNVALSWFKDSAKEHMARVYELCAILEAHDVHVEVLRTERPGYVVYEDNFQVAAEPFQDTPS